MTQTTTDGSATDGSAGAGDSETATDAPQPTEAAASQSAPEATDETTPDDAAPTDDASTDDASTDDASTDATGDDAAAGDDATDGTPRKTGAQRLEEEGDVAADYLEELLDITDLDGDIDIDVENGRAAVSIVADQSDPASARALTTLVGRDGEVLEALQELTRLAVQTRTGERTRLMLDVAGFRAGRRTELEQLALATVATVKESGASVSLDPMSPFERKVVHDAVAGAGLRSESEGEGSDRRVVVLPAEE